MRKLFLLMMLIGVPVGLSGCDTPAGPDGQSGAESEEGHDHEGHDHDHEGHEDDHADAEEAKMIEEALGKLSDADRTLAVAQKICPVSEHALGTMGAPPKVDVDGKPVFICCEGCRELLLDNKEEMMAKLKGGEAADAPATDAPKADGDDAGASS